VIAGGAAVLSLAVGSFVVLNQDWMSEWRFLTPVWPLLTAAVVLGIASLAASAAGGWPRVGLVAVVAIAVVSTFAGWVERSQVFARTPNVPLCFVARRFGHQFNTAADMLGIPARRATVLLADVGGTLLTAELRVIDLAGLIDRDIAELRAQDDPVLLAEFILTELQPTFIRIHGPWATSSGLPDEPRFTTDYAELVPGRDYVRRDALSVYARRRFADIATSVEQMAASADDARRRDPKGSCDDLLA